MMAAHHHYFRVFAFVDFQKKTVCVAHVTFEMRKALITRVDNVSRQFPAASA